MDSSFFKKSNPEVDKKNWKPISAVWELTLECNLRCGHCGSRAGNKLSDEMTTEECFRLADQLKEAGCELITLSGGEPTLRKDWDIIAGKISDNKITVNMVTNGVYGKDVSAGEIARRALRAGMCNAGVSLDGPEEVHDRIRGRGTFSKTSSSIKTFVENGLSVTVMTTINKLNLDRLWEIRDIAKNLGARAIRFQLAKPMGTMDDNRNWVISPNSLITLLPDLAKMKQAGGIDVRVGDSLGYYGKPDKVLRDVSWRKKKSEWGGCQAGLRAVGIQANGDIKGCLSLQADHRGLSDPFVEGNVRNNHFMEIWYRKGAFSYNRGFSVEKLTHDCKQCDQAQRCRGGARCISTAIDGTLTHDDYCYYRLCQENETFQWIAAGKSAAAAAAVVFAVNTAGCKTDSKPEPRDTQADTESEILEDTELENDTRTDYGVDPNETDTYEVLEYGVQPDYGVEPPDTDVMTEYGVEPNDTDAMTDYGVEPPDTDVMTEYGVEPNDTDAMTDYGVEPPDTDRAVPEYGVEPD